MKHCEYKGYQGAIKGLGFRIRMSGCRETVKDRHRASLGSPSQGAHVHQLYREYW